MPPTSRKQARAMFAAQEGKSTLGIPQSVGSEFVAGLVGHPGSVNALPQRAKSSRVRVPKPKQINVHVHLNGK